jgi:hypothetical protein
MAVAAVVVQAVIDAQSLENHQAAVDQLRHH